MNQEVRENRLPASIESEVVQPLGSFMTIDDKGNFVSEANWEKVQSPWREAVLAARDAYVTHLGDRLHSVYVRGTVAKGEAIAGVSDIDTIALVYGASSEEDRIWAKVTRDELALRAPFATGVELEIFELDYVLDLNRDVQVKFILKDQAACIYGENVADKLPNFQPNTELAQGLYSNFPVVLERAQIRLERAKNDEEVQKHCRWAMKRMIRRVAAVMMPESHKYSRDLYPTYILFAERYPQQENLMHQALQWAIEPTTDRGAVKALVDELGDFIRMEAQRIFTSRE